MKCCQMDPFGCFKTIWLNDRNCTDQMTALLKTFFSLGGFVGVVMPLVGVFWFFLLATDITVPVKFCSMSQSVLHKNIVPPSTLALLFPFRNTICLHTLASRPCPLLYFSSSRGGRPWWPWCSGMPWYVFIHDQIIINRNVLSDTCAALSTRIRSCQAAAVLSWHHLSYTFNSEGKLLQGIWLNMKLAREFLV